MDSFATTPLTMHMTSAIISIPNELLEDSRLSIRVWTDTEWAQYVEEMRAERRHMDKDGASWRDKVRLTWRIKRAARGNPRFTWEAS